MEINFEYVDPFNEKYDYWMRVEHLARYLWAGDILKDSENVLDVACANGYGTNLISQKVKKVVGIDKNERYLDIARTKYHRENILYERLDVDSQKIKGNYDAILCFETLEHVKYPQQLLEKLYSVLKDNGLLLLSVPNSKYEKFINGKNKDPYHLNVFEYDDLVELVKAKGFTIMKILGQSYTNKIVNGIAPETKKTDIYIDAKTCGYPNEEDISYTYSYIFILKK